MVKFGDDYRFDTPTGPKTLVDLFDDRDQLRRCTSSSWTSGRDSFCPGCTALTKNVTDLDDLAASGVSWATISNMPLAQIEAYKAQMGWTLPFVSRHTERHSRRTPEQVTSFAERLFPRRRYDVYLTYLHYRQRRGRPGDVRQQHLGSVHPTDDKKTGKTRRPWLATATNVRMSRLNRAHQRLAFYSPDPDPGTGES